MATREELEQRWAEEDKILEKNRKERLEKEKEIMDAIAWQKEGSSGKNAGSAPRRGGFSFFPFIVVLSHKADTINVKNRPLPTVLKQVEEEEEDPTYLPSDPKLKGKSKVGQLMGWGETSKGWSRYSLILFLICFQFNRTPQAMMT